MISFNRIAQHFTTNQPWYCHKPVWIMLFLGFSAGIPLFLVFGSLSLWLREAGVERSAVTFFSWAVLGYSFKFLWAPLVDRVPIFVLTQKLGRRRSWLICSQIAIIFAICFMASTDPSRYLMHMAVGAVLLGFSSATQDIVIDAYRIESGEVKLQALMSSTYVAGYRIGMMVAGAWALLLAESFGSTSAQYSYEAWRKTYFLMALFMCVGVVTTLLIKEPLIQSKQKNIIDDFLTKDYIMFCLVFMFSIFTFIVAYQAMAAIFAFIPFDSHVVSFFLSAIKMFLALAAATVFAYLCAKWQLVNKAMVKQSYFAPFEDFFKRYAKHAVWLLLLICFYRVSDIVLGVISNIFYQDMGYSKTHIATITKFFGVIVTILGAIIGGVIALKLGVLRSLLVGAVLVSLTNLLFLWLAQVGSDYILVTLSLPFLISDVLVIPLELTLVIMADNLAQGLAIAAFIGWLSSLTNIAFSATQYAVFSSLMTLLPKLLGGYSGLVVDGIGYSWFFLTASALGIPVILLIIYIAKRDKALVDGAVKHTSYS